MPLRLRLALLSLATLGMTACTTLSVEERTAACQATDWANYGLNDGILGVSADERDKKFADCADLDTPADLGAYQAGRAEGLLIYCTVENGYEVGHAGRRYRDVCPPELEAAFLQGYEQGRKERPAGFYPYFGLGFGSFGHPYVGYRVGYGYRRHRRHHRHRGRGK